MQRIDTSRCPVVMLTGEYDYSCTPEASRATAAKIPGAEFREMKGLGHFPMTENPEAFLEYLRPALARLRAREPGQGLNKCRLVTPAEAGVQTNRRGSRLSAGMTIFCLCRFSLMSCLGVPWHNSVRTQLVEVRYVTPTLPRSCAT